MAGIRKAVEGGGFAQDVLLEAISYLVPMGPGALQPREGPASSSTRPALLPDPWLRSQLLEQRSLHPFLVSLAGGTW